MPLGSKHATVETRVACGRLRPPCNCGRPAAAACGPALQRRPPCGGGLRPWCSSRARDTPGSAYPQPEPNATELPSSAPGRPKLIKLHASAHSPTPTRAEEHIATTPDCRLRALARRRAPKRTSHYTCWCERNTLRETLGALATWVPPTAMLPLPLALSLSLTSSWQQHNFSLSAPRRSAGTAAAARSCGVVVCCDRDDVLL